MDSVDISTVRLLLQVDKKVNLRRNYVNRIPSGARFLDIGCGSGGYLIAAKELGFDVTGVEPSESHSRIGRALGLNIHDGFRAEEFLPNYFDFVILSHVIEHIHNPKKFIVDY